MRIVPFLGWPKKIIFRFLRSKKKTKLWNTWLAGGGMVLGGRLLIDENIGDEASPPTYAHTNARIKKSRRE